MSEDILGSSSESFADGLSESSSEGLSSSVASSSDDSHRTRRADPARRPDGARLTDDDLRGIPPR